MSLPPRSLLLIIRHTTAPLDLLRNNTAPLLLLLTTVVCPDGFTATPDQEACVHFSSEAVSGVLEAALK